MLSQLIFEDGFMGGKWYITDGQSSRAPFPFVYCPKKTCQLNINGATYLAEMITISGSDYDHGHEYKWEATDFIITEESFALGQIEISIRKVMKEGKLAVYLEHE